MTPETPTPSPAATTAHAGGPPTGVRRRRRAVVVGAGISGLAAAWQLVQRDDVGEVTVLERSGRPGGVLSGGSLTLPDGTPVPVDLGAEALLARRPEALALAHEVGLGEDLVHPATTAARLLARGRLVALPSDTLMGVPRDPASLADLLDEAELRRAEQEPDVPADPVDGDVSVGAWVAARFGPAVVDRLVEPLLGGVYAGHADRLSLRATLPMVWPLATGGGSVVTTLASRPPAPPTAGGGAKDPGPVFAGVRGGVHRLAGGTARALADRGVQLRYDSTVRAVRRTADGFRVELGRADAPSWLDADLVVVAVPAPAAARLLAGVAPRAGAELAQVETASMAVVTALVHADALPEGGAWSGVLVPPVEGLTIKASTFSSVKWPWMRDHLPVGVAAVRVSLGRAGEEEVLQRPDDDLTRLALEELGRALGRTVRPVAPTGVTTVTRWGGALPQYAVGHTDRIARIRADVATVPGLGLAGSVLDGVGIPACIAAARAAVEQASVSLAEGASGGVPVTGTMTA